MVVGDEILQTKKFNKYCDRNTVSSRANKGNNNITRKDKYSRIYCFLYRKRHLSHTYATFLIFFISYDPKPSLLDN